MRDEAISRDLHDLAASVERWANKLDELRAQARDEDAPEHAELYDRVHANLVAGHTAIILASAQMSPEEPARMRESSEVLDFMIEALGDEDES